MAAPSVDETEGTMSPRGGARPGGGRKPVDGETRRQITVYLPADTLRRLDAIRGDEIRSHLIARVLRDYLERPAR
jgi:hypothetical protein